MFLDRVTHVGAALGEKGGELFIPTTLAPSLWKRFCKAGQSLQMAPVGLGARDGLRLEMGYPLYGHELGEDITPYESGLSWVVKLNKKECIASAALKDKPMRRALVGLVLKGGGVLRQNQQVLNEASEAVGVISSGGVSCALDRASIGMAFVDLSCAEVQSLKVSLRSKEAVVKRVKPPFIQVSK